MLLEHLKLTGIKAECQRNAEGLMLQFGQNSNITNESCPERYICPGTALRMQENPRQIASQSLRS